MLKRLSKKEDEKSIIVPKTIRLMKLIVLTIDLPKILQKGDKKPKANKVFLVKIFSRIFQTNLLNLFNI